MKALESTLSMGIAAIIAVLGIAGAGAGVNAVITKMPGAEYSCKVTSITTDKDNPSNYTVTTDGCNDSHATAKTFHVASTKAATDPAFVSTDFIHSAPNGKSYNLTLEGMTVPAFGSIPTITGVTEDVFTDSLFTK